MKEEERGKTTDLLKENCQLDRVNTMGMSRSDCIVNPLFRNIMYHAYQSMQIEKHKLSFCFTQINYIQFPQRNRLSHASEHLYVLFPLLRICLSSLIFPFPCSLSLHPQDTHSSPHFPLKTSFFFLVIQTFLSLSLSPSCHNTEYCHLSCAPKLHFTYIRKIYNADIHLFIHSPVFFSH